MKKVLSFFLLLIGLSFLEINGSQQQGVGDLLSADSDAVVALLALSSFKSSVGAPVPVAESVINTIDDQGNDSINSDEEEDDETHLLKRKKMTESFSCQYSCGEAFSTTYLRKRHYIFAHDHVGHVCSSCDKKFVTSNKLKEHERTHLKTSDEVKKSTEKQHDKKHICPECNKECADKKRLRAHQEVHLPDEQKSFQCLNCPKGFTSKTNLDLHLLRDHLLDEQKPFSCSGCSKHFVTVQELTRHAEQHLPDDQRSYKCLTCGKGFAIKDALDLHAEQHLPEDQRSYKCLTCGKGFGRVHNLKTHEKIHLPKEEMPYKCLEDGCSYASVRKDDLIRHRVNHLEPQENRFYCSFCDKGFSDKHEFKKHGASKRHLKKMSESGKGDDIESSDDKETEIHALSEKNLYCKYSCGQNFATYYARKLHYAADYNKADHTYICCCSENFETKDELEAHKEEKHGKEKNLYCRYSCGQTFATYYARKLHYATDYNEAEDTYICCCGENFETKDELEAHKEEKHNIEKDTV